MRPGLRDGREVVETIHDRIRETIVALLPADVVRGHHGRLARVLEATPGAEPEAVAMHLLGAGETERGGRFASKAAERAATLLAFDQAARLFQLAIDTTAGVESRPAARATRGGARVGRAERAGGAGVHCGRRSRRALCSRPARARRRGAAARSGAHRGGGGRCFAASSPARGSMSPPRRRTIVASLIAAKTDLQSLVLRFEERNADEVPAAERARIDAMHVAALGLASVDIILAACMQARELVEALRAGDRARTCAPRSSTTGATSPRAAGPYSAHERDVHALIERLVEQGGSAEELAFSRGT